MTASAQEIEPPSRRPFQSQRDDTRSCDIEAQAPKEVSSQQRKAQFLSSPISSYFKPSTTHINKPASPGPAQGTLPPLPSFDRRRRYLSGHLLTWLDRPNIKSLVKFLTFYNPYLQLFIILFIFFIYQVQYNVTSLTCLLQVDTTTVQTSRKFFCIQNYSNTSLRAVIKTLLQPGFRA